MERLQTIRETLRAELLRGPATARELSTYAPPFGLARRQRSWLLRRVGIPEKDVADHLGHLEKSSRARGERLVVEPASCIACGYSFAKRARLTRPGSCPSCRSTRIDPPAFRLEAPRSA